MSTCAHCGTEYVRAKGNQRFCSDPCRFMTPPAADLIAAILLRHGPDECRGVRHIQGTAECVFYRAALAAVGLKGSV